ncbi:MAG: EAL domain-containing protein, partial [Atopobiaceae bacterium]|nr:EAL domain-containing protein [Atopobiaceae bacterium]
GIVEDVDHDLPADQLCDRAAIAMQNLKGSSGAGVAFYDERLRQQQLTEQIIIEGMSSAIRERQFIINYQPKHDVHTGKIAGAEALVRWNHPELGLIRPDLFISIFERNGLITDLDRYVCEEVCREIRRCVDLGLPPIPISINLSRIDFDDPDLASQIARIADRYDIDRSLLHIEVTETAYSEDPDAVVRALEELRDYGFHIELDDFGSGYSSLASLNMLPLDILKLDGTMIRQATKLNDFRIIQSAIQIAQFLGLETVVEGVETTEELTKLKEMGCDLIQGIYYSWPLGQVEFEAYLARAVES